MHLTSAEEQIAAKDKRRKWVAVILGIADYATRERYE